MILNKVTTLPTVLEPDEFYLVLNGDYAETYVTSNSGEAKRVGNSVMITEVANAGGGIGSEVLIVADIAERDTLAPTTNILSLVVDASADVTVDTGGALYVYDTSQTAWFKLAEYESFNENLILDWSSIQNGPTSSVVDIDNAVNASHSHTNKDKLDKIDENGNGDPTYNGKDIAILKVNNW